MGDWLAERLDLFRALGRSFVDLVAAELGELSTDFRRSGKGLAIALGLFAGALFVTFWTVAALISALVVIVDIWLPLWASALIVTGLMLALALALAGLGWWRLRSLEAPARTLARRWGEHRLWWEQRVVGAGMVEKHTEPAVAERKEGEHGESTG